VFGCLSDHGARRNFIGKKLCSLWEWLPAVAVEAAMAESAPASIKSRQDAAPTKRNQLIWKVFGCFVEKTALLSIGRSKQKDTRTPKHKTPNPQTLFNKNFLDFKSSSKYDPSNLMPETVLGY
jgi:hypothetical protein